MIAWLKWKWCAVVGHRWGVAPKLDGRVCRRCREWQPTFKQMFATPKISGRASTTTWIDDPIDATKVGPPLDREMIYDWWKKQNGDVT